MCISDCIEPLFQNENSMMTNNGEVCHADLVAEELSDVGIEAKGKLQEMVCVP